MPEPQEKSKGEPKKEPEKKPEKPRTAFARFRVMLSEIFRPGKNQKDWPKQEEEEKNFNWTIGVDR
jgi:hypothetical protein